MHSGLDYVFKKMSKKTSLVSWNFKQINKSRPKKFNTSQVPWDLDKIFTFRLCHTNLTWLRKDTSQAFGQVKNLANKKAELNRSKRKNSAFFHNP